MEKFYINTEYIELCNLLKCAGPHLTGGQAKLLIISGEIKVNGEIELRKKCKIRPGQIVTGENFSIQVTTQTIN